MIIRCPQCEHSRSIHESKIPPTAELVTCPRCKHRFRFRTLRPAKEPEHSPLEPARNERPQLADQFPAQEVHRPQEAFREAAAQSDIWDAVDALHHRWQAQLDQHVTEVEVPSAQAPAHAGSPMLADEPRFASLGSRQAAAGLRPSSGREPHGSKTAFSHTAPEDFISSGLGGEAASSRSAAGTRAAPASPDFSPRPFAESQPNAAEKSRETAPTYFSAEDEAGPEKWGEHDLRSLRENRASLPLRDLGQFREYTETEEEPAPVGDEKEEPEVGLPSTEGGVPWENPVKHGWLKGFMSTVRAVMFQSPAFFSSVTSEGSLAPGYLFFLILGYVTILAALAWEQAAASLLAGIYPLPVNRIALPILLLLAPIALGLMLLFVAGFIRIVVSLFAPERADFSLVYKVVSYSVAPFVLSVVPFVGPPLGAFWFLASLIAGCRYALKLSWPLASLAPVPPAAMLLGGLIWYFL